MRIGGEEDNGNVSGRRIGAHQLEDLKPINDGHLDIEDDHAGLFSLDTGVSFGAMLARHRIDSNILKRVTDEVNDGPFVIHHDGRCSRCPFHSSSVQA